MKYYKSLRIINGKPKWVITNENDKIIEESPTKEQITSMIDKGKKKNNYEGIKCMFCGRDWTSGVWYHVIVNGIWDGKSRECSRCYQNQSNDHFRKPLANFRTGNLSRNSAHGRGFIGAQIVAKVHRMEDCNIRTDNFCFYVDLSNKDYGRSEVKTSSYRIKHGTWGFGPIKPWNFDNLFLLCMDENFPWKDVIKVYIIPSEDIDVSSITIYTGNSTKLSRWDRYITENRIYNDIYHSMKLKNCTVLREGL